MTDSSPVSSRVREVVRHDLVRRQLIVDRTQRLTSTMLRVTLTGDDLAGFSSPGPEDHVKLFVPTPTGVEARRDYTPRAFRAELRELDIDVALHGGTGPAETWAANARPGSAVAIGGPRGSRLAPSGYRRFVLLADETALPALSRWIETSPEDTDVKAFIQSDAADITDYPLPDGARVSVLPTGSAAALDALAAEHPDGDAYVWAAGEATALIPVRRYLRTELGLSRDDVKVDGYWRRGVAGADHHAPLDPEHPDD